MPKIQQLVFREYLRDLKNMGFTFNEEGTFATLYLKKSDIFITIELNKILSIEQIIQEIDDQIKVDIDEISTNIYRQINRE